MEDMVGRAIQIDSKDNVATTTAGVDAGGVVEVIGPDGMVILMARVSEQIPFGHKIAIETIKQGGNVVKYGEVIGVATQPIDAGAWVNTHNVGSARMPTRGREEGIL